MNAGRFVGASVAVWLVRTVLNYLFYGMLIHGRFEEISAAHPDMFREVVPAFITLDLLAALLITYVFVKAAGCFGGGMKAGVTIGILIAILGPIIGGLYYFFSVTYYPVDLLGMESVYQLVAHAIQGAIAAAIYKTA
jgi:hypothetical protein